MSMPEITERKNIQLHRKENSENDKCFLRIHIKFLVFIVDNKMRLKIQTAKIF